VTDAYRRFANTVTEQGAVFGVPFSAEYSDFLERSYEGISGVSPYENSAAGAAYREAFDDCTAATPEAEDDSLSPFAEPAVAVRPIILCVADAVHSVERDHGAGTVGYSVTFQNFAYDNTPSDESVNYPSAASTYTAITGRSPLVSTEATQAFIELARSCPDPP
jgi:hypothetical protein